MLCVSSNGWTTRDGSLTLILGLSVRAPHVRESARELAGNEDDSNVPLAEVSVSNVHAGDLLRGVVGDAGHGIVEVSLVVVNPQGYIQ